MSKISRSLFVFSLCLFTRLHAQSVPDMKDWIARYMRNSAKFDHFSGVVLVADHGKVVFEQAYGMANYELRVPNTLDTKFRIGSVSKTFTAAAIVKLWQDGKLDIDQPVTRYLADCPSAWQKITVRQLLSHTSGLVSFTGLPEASGDFLLVPHEPKALLKTFWDKPLESVPGEVFKYNNSAYLLLGLIIEQVSGKNYETYLKETFFKPLGLRNTGVDRADTLLANRAHGYRPVSDTQLANSYTIDMSNSFAIGGLYPPSKTC